MYKNLLQKLLNLIFPPNTLELTLESTTISDISEFMHIQNKANIVSLLPYKEPLIRALVHTAKFKNNQHSAELLGKVLADYLLSELSDQELFASAGSGQIFLVPIPLSSQRRRERGFNQSECICQVAQQQLPEHLSVLNLLTRPHHRPPQTRASSRTERIKNIKGVFAINQAVARSLSPQIPIFIIDDVTTTGATLKEAIKTITESGFTNVSAIALAH